MTEKRTTILVVRLSALGDVAMTLPVIYSFARQYPQLDVAVVTRPFFGRIFVNAPSNVRIVAINPADYRGPVGTWRMFRKLAAERPVYVADLHNVLRSWIINLCMTVRGVKVRMVDKARSKRRRLYGASGERQAPYIERYCRVFEKLGFPVNLNFSSIYEGVELPEPPLAVGDRAIGIAPFARYATKTYPEPMIRSVIETLARRGYPIYLFGGRGEEAERLERWADSIPGVVSVAGRFFIEQELALIAHMKLMITMDSSNQHLAAITGTRVLSIWGSTTPACGFLGYGQNAGDTLCAGLTCQPCSVAGLEKCPLGTDECMKAITPEKVVERVVKLVPPVEL